MSLSLFGRVGPEQDRDRYLDLVERHFDGRLTAEESRDLGRLLAANADCAREFARRAMFHDQIRALLRYEQEARGQDDPSISALLPEAIAGRARAVSSRWLPLAATAVAALSVAIVGLWGVVRSLLVEGETAVVVAESVEAVSQPAERLPPVAKLAAAFDAVWSDPNIAYVLRQGDMPAGMLTLVSGRVEFLFAAGATAVIEGPATFEPVSRDTLRVAAGSVRCRCPQPGTELRVETPSGTIVDLGTEFAVTVEPDVRTRVAVIEGQVRVDGKEASRLMSAGDAVSIDREGRSSDDIGFLKDVATRVTLAAVDPRVFTDSRNVLADPSFEAETTGHQSGGREPSTLGDFRLGRWRGSLGHVEPVTAPVASGSQAVRIAACGSRFWPLVGQPAETGDIAGQPVMASVKVCQQQDDPLRGNQCAIVKLVFADAAGRAFAQAERYFLRSGSKAGEFVEAGIAVLAPAGTATVQYQVLLNACGMPTGSIVVDDAALLIGRE
jgi:hypothetical protein